MGREVRAEMVMALRRTWPPASRWLPSIRRGISLIGNGILAGWYSGKVDVD